MIPALATIVAVYVVFRCITITFDALNRAVPSEFIRALALIFVILCAVGTIVATLFNLSGIHSLANDATF